MKSVGFKTDAVALSVWKTLLSDFRTVLGEQFALNAEKAFECGIGEFRGYEWPSLGIVDVFRFKAYRQLELLYKRHVFEFDPLQATERRVVTMEKFMANNLRLPAAIPQRLSVRMVLREARRICREVLGKYDENEAIEYSKIGSRATLGGPRQDAYIDCKLGLPKAFTCPSILRNKIFDQIKGDPVLKGIVRSVFKTSRRTGEHLVLDADSLDLVLVPKSWKVDRPITPMSLWGLFWSYGIKGVVENRLKSIGLDIRILQRQHKKLARRFSKSRTHVTADLSSASDSLTRPLLNALLPRDWYNALKLTFVNTLKFGDSEFYTQSALPMGNAATFPVETLIFYSLIRAIGNLLNVKGTFSVYGDDLIYPRRIHPYVLEIFSSLGLLINGDKTFVSSYFRESCGGDYYRGCDVRPALLPENTSPVLKGLRYQSYLYKVLNSLLERWDECEIQSTVDWIEGELLRVSKRDILRVPMHFPPTSGKQVRNPVPRVMWYEDIRHSNFRVNETPIQQGCSFYTFLAIMTTKPKNRPVLSTTPYYWEWLRSTHVNRKLCASDRVYVGYHEGCVSPLIYRYSRKEPLPLVLTPLKQEGPLRTIFCSIEGWKQPC